MSGRAVLLIEDSDTQRALLGSHLDGMGYRVASAPSGAEGLELMARARPDIVLLDVVMPQMDGWETLEQIRQVSGVPVIMLTAENSQVDRVRGLRTGADDYISKPFGQEELTARIEAVLRRAGEARSDALTGLPNARAFREHLDAVLRAATASEQVCVVVFDLDDFKRINDTEGHPVGDQVLRATARIALREVRIGEEAFRIGGEEFALVIRGDCTAGICLAERIQAAIASHRREPRLPTLSGGVAAFPGDGDAREELVRKADLALYAAKGRGKNQIVAYDASLDQPVG